MAHGRHDSWQGEREWSRNALVLYKMLHFNAY